VKLLPFVRPTLAHPLDYPFGSLVHQVSQCLRHFQPPGHSMEGPKFKHQEMGKMPSQAPFPL
jgi:hypothetical protein